MAQYVDPGVSRAKVAREIAEYRENDAAYLRRGWFLSKVEFPDVIVVMAAVQLEPVTIPFAVRLRFENYDAEPPSVHLVKPFTHEPFQMIELPTALPYGTKEVAPDGSIKVSIGAGYLQASAPNEVPFFCHRGVFEYHHHPGHDGDLWEVYRGRGEGRLVRLLNLVYEHGILPMTAYAFSYVVDPRKIPVVAG